MRPVLPRDITRSCALIGPAGCSENKEKNYVSDFTGCNTDVLLIVFIGCSDFFYLNSPFNYFTLSVQMNMYDMIYITVLHFLLISLCVDQLVYTKPNLANKTCRWILG